MRRHLGKADALTGAAALGVDGELELGLEVASATCARGKNGGETAVGARR
jgi:hypothetical protein